MHLVHCLYYLYQWCTVKQITDNEIYLLIKYIKSLLWGAAKRLSYIEEARCLKVNNKNYRTVFMKLNAYSLCDIYAKYMLGIRALPPHFVRICAIVIHVKCKSHLFFLWVHDVLCVFSPSVWEQTNGWSFFISKRLNITK